MAILSAETEVASMKTASEIQGLLGSKGANSVSVEYSLGEAAAIYFSINVNGQPINFKLPANWEGVLRALRKDNKLANRFKTTEQAKRVSWRIILTWVKAQLALIEAGQAEMAEVFMPYAVTSSGQTLFQKMLAAPETLIGLPEHTV